MRCEERKKEKEMKRQQKTKQKKVSGNFTAKEIELLRKDMYDLKTDERYNQWLKAHDVSSNRTNSKLDIIIKPHLHTCIDRFFVRSIHWLRGATNVFLQ